MVIFLCSLLSLILALDIPGARFMAGCACRPSSFFAQPVSARCNVAANVSTGRLMSAVIKLLGIAKKKLMLHSETRIGNKTLGASLVIGTPKHLHTTMH